MKIKYLAIFALLTILLLAAGCGKKAAPAETPTPVAPAPSSAPVEQPPVVDVAEESSAETSEEEVVEAVILEEGGDITETADEEKAATGLAVDFTTESPAFPQASCELAQVEGKEVRLISAKVTNVEEGEWVIYGKANPKGNVRLGNRGVIDITADCDTLTLQPGESTLCRSISKHAAVVGENRVTVNTPGQQYARVVICP
jgi:hypothetical protein